MVSNEKANVYCAGTYGGSHDNEWGNIGFSPCGEFVSHESDKPCNVIESTTITKITEPKTCQCNTGLCPCGSFVAHKVFEPCNANS